MRRKNSTVQCKFHPMLTAFLFKADEYYSNLGSEVTITSGSETITRHGYTSLHYATPCQAADVRSWTVIYGEVSYTAKMQHKELIQLAIDFCTTENIPADWVEVILESDHHHIEFQPKRQEGV